MDFEIKTCYGNFIVRPTYDVDTNVSAFAIYKYDDYLGEMFSQYDIIDYREYFVEDLEKWLKDFLQLL